MTIEEIMKWLEENKGKDEVESFVKGLITLDRVKAFVVDDKEARSWLDGEKDKHSDKCLRTWKTNNLENLIDTEIKKRFPDKDPKDNEIEKIRLELEKVKQEAFKKELTNKAYLLADEKKLPKEFIPYLLGDDEEKTTENINKIAELFDTHITSQVDDRLKNGYKPPQGDETKTGGIGSQLAKQAVDNQDAMLEAQKNYFS